MPKSAPIQSNFSGGEFSPLTGARVELDRYKTGLAVCSNYIPLIQGPVTRRPGTVYISEVKTSSKATRLVYFEFSTTQAYMIEMGDQYMRFYMDYGQIQSGPGAYEIATPYLEADLFNIRFVQSADVIYLVHETYAPRKLTRSAHTSWTLTLLDWLDGPYLNLNTTATTIALSGATGSVTVTASTAIFASTDVGRVIRKQDGGNWSWMKITAFTDTTHVTALIRGPAMLAAATANWRLGLWSDTTGYPTVVTFHEDRLCFSGHPQFPQRIDMSNTGDYENFKSTDATGTVSDSFALSFTLNSADVNTLRWMLSAEKGLLAGTVGGEWRIASSFQGEALGATTAPSAKQVGGYGSARLAPVFANDSIMFVQRSKKKLREMSYYFEKDGYRSPNRTVIAEHMPGATGFKEIVLQKEPQSIVWCCRQDGVLAGMTYERDEDSLIIGWHRHIIGGFADSAGSPAVVESVACIPSPDGTRNDLWMIVRRRINGATQRYIEVMSKLFEDTDAQVDAFFVDAGLTYDNPKTITGITSAAPPVVTSVAHGFLNGDLILLSEIASVGDLTDGATNLLSELLNNNTYMVANKTADTFEIKHYDGTAISAAGYSAYISSGYARKYITTIAGLDHLEGESVSICADGAVQPNRTVTAGAITLQTRAAGPVHIGYSYESDGQLLVLDSGAANGTSLGKTRRTHRVGFNLHRSLGLKIGTDFENLDTLVFRKTSDPLSRAVPLFSGTLSQEIEADYDFQNQVCWRQDQPLPSTVLAVLPQMDTQDRE